MDTACSCLSQAADVFLQAMPVFRVAVVDQQVDLQGRQAGERDEL